ncbi:MAG: hypothetical protein MJZ53_06740, partial [Paludibacteraceae bacterium]|nr:hypothetical protein [Paludibacteraceae bacterium]
MKKLFLFLGAILLSTCLWAKQGGTLTSTPSPINPSENAVINYDGTGTNFANWEPLCYVHAWLVAAEGQEFSKSYTTEWTTCNGDEEYAKLDDKVKMTYSGTKGKYSITMNIKSFFGVEDADLPKIAKLGIIVKSQWNKEDESQNVTEDLFVNVGEPQPTIYYVTGNAALVGEEKQWQADAIEMTAGTYTFKDLAAGEYQLKVTDGTWSNAWGYDALSKTVAIEGLYPDVDDNICFTVYTPNDVTVTLTEGHIVTVTGDFKAPTKYYAKNNWNGDEWSWLEMTKVEDLYVLDSVIFGGTGVNINTKEEDTDAKWFALKDMTYVGEDTIQALDTVRFELAISKEDTVLTAIKLGRPEPAARKEFVFVADEAADSDPALFAITWGKDGSNETVKLANKADDIYTAEILETVDSLVLVRCASDATEIIWDGEGKNVWNQTANYELCDTMYFESWVPETNLFAVTCEAPKPVETKYYAKNNWNGAAAEDWSWLEMSATDQENIYMLD